MTWQQRLNAGALEWQARKRSADLLLRGLPLAEAQDWQKKKPDGLISKAAQSHLSKLVQRPAYKSITIRNWNTTTKLLEMTLAYSPLRSAHDLKPN